MNYIKYNAMKKYSWFLIFVIAVLLSGCVPTPDVRFLEPQPVNKHDLKIIPKEYQGKYVSKSDSSMLKIDSKVIFQEWKGVSKVSDIEMQKEFDTVYLEDIRVDLSENWSMIVEIDGDSAIIKTHGVDTLFVLDSKTKLRKFKGYLFLNYVRADSTWKVKTLKLENNQLDFEDLVRHTEIDSLREITPISSKFDSTSNRFKYHDLQPKRKELKKILEKKVPDSKFLKVE